MKVCKIGWPKGTNSVFKHTIPAKDKGLLSNARNVDQDQRQPSGEPVLIRTINEICEQLLKEKGDTNQVKPSEIITRYSSVATGKMNSNIVASYGRLCCKLGCKEYVSELLDWMSDNVNPCDLQCSPASYEDVSKASRP